MKSKFFKIAGFTIAFIVLVFFFFQDSVPKKEAAKNSSVEISDTTTSPKAEKKENEEEQKKETEVIIEKNEKTEKNKNNLPTTNHSSENSVTTEEKTPIPAPEENNSLYCTLSVDCTNIYDNISDFPEEKKILLPNDGYILPPLKIEFNEGESVFDVLKRELIERKIHFEFSEAAYNSAYIEGINNIYEFDCGELSGWVYSVNGIVPQYSCSEYKIKNNDIIKIIYTCNLGKDIE